MGLLSEEVKQYPILYDKQIKEHRKKYVVSNAWSAWAKDREFIENGKSNITYCRKSC